MSTQSLELAAAEAALIRRKFAGDPHRPRFHFLPPSNWMNDPNGLIEWKGRFHLFYQYNPNGAFHGTIHWGHAVSDDLVHWDDLPIALAPTPGGPDGEGCWSGCAVNAGGVPALVYTGISPQVVCVATGSPDLVHWDKLPANPVIDGPPDDLRARCAGDFRDPFLWRDGDRWHMVIGSRIEGQGGLVLLYHSEDLVRWQFAGTLVKGGAQQKGPLWTGDIWECPNLLDFGDRQALIISAQSRSGELMYAFYLTGHLRGDNFQPEQQRILVHGRRGECFYAPQATLLADGRILMFGWLCEGLSAARRQTAGWAGIMSLPLSVSLLPDGALALEPVAELQSLRGRHWHFDAIDLPAGSGQLLDGVRGDCLEIIARFEAGSEGAFGLKLRCSPGDVEYTCISVRMAEQQIVLERDRSSLDPEVYREPCRAPLRVAPDAPLTLHIFLDRSVIEIFTGDGRTTLTARIYPTLAESVSVGIFSREGPVRLAALDIWALEDKPVVD